VDLGRGCAMQRHCVTCTPLAASNLSGRPQAEQARARRPGMCHEISQCQHSPLAKQTRSIRSHMCIQLVPVLPSLRKWHSLLIGLGTPSGNGNALTYYPLVSSAETKCVCFKPASYFSKIVLEVKCIPISGVVSAMLL